MRTSTRARWRLLKNSDLDTSIRLSASVRDSPTPSTPPLVVPGAPTSSDTVGINKPTRKLYKDNNEKVDIVYSNERVTLAWAKAARELVLGGKEVRFTVGADVDNLTEIVVILKNDFGSAGPDLASFELDERP
ncbi:hypothetical protein CYMTET_9591 [Cymbomonas tetramitiformis]|uniref:Uncharacterized protein n=1 Tax=Cymbomonas tetramitiformis TaxID=36881 RepID=A0AAE0LFB4_9CHLO|nr:hypothetical protein CYMTET_9591 [Cymbomonas tetramitiformis]